MIGAVLVSERSRVLTFQDVIDSLRELDPLGSHDRPVRPAGIAVAQNGTVVVADEAPGRLCVYDLAGGGWTTLFGPGSAVDQLMRPSDVTVDATGRLVIADRGNRRIVRCEADGSGWEELGSPGTGVGEFVDPRSVAVDDWGRVIVADPGAARVVRFDDFDGSGWAQASYPVPADPAVPSFPMGVAAVGEHWAVADAGARAVYLLDLDDGLVAATGPASKLVLPTYVAGDGDGLLVGDPTANEVRRFHPENGVLVEDLRLRGSDPSLPAPVFERLGGVAAGRV